MRTLAFDGRMGASGDMILGALLAAGGDPDRLSVIESALPIQYAIDTTEKCGIEATTVDVLVEDDHDDHDHDDHDHDDGGSDTVDAEHTHAEGHGPHRTHDAVVDIVESMELPAGVESDALAVFELLGEAEATVHGTDLDEIRFHEVGADDAIADVVGACLLVADLHVERIVTTPLATGGGEVEMHHGTYQVPVPAVVEIAGHADWSLRGGPVEREILTPTGAAVLAHFADGVEHVPVLTVEASGYGAGDYDAPDRPNVLRAIVGDGGATDERLQREEITVLETHVDDASPELLGGLQETLAEVGALDVTVVPATMKKSRPGHLVKVVTHPTDAERVARQLVAETGTLGVREHGAGHRWTANRELRTVTVDIGNTQYDVDVKIATDAAGDVVDVSAEFDDAAAVARETGRPIRDVMERAEGATRVGDGG